MDYQVDLKCGEWRFCRAPLLFLLFSLLFWPVFHGVASAQDRAPDFPLPTRHSPLFWADGITQIDDLDAYQKIGFNTVVVRLYWTPSPDGAISVSPRDVAPQREFAEEAGARGLKVIFALPAVPVGMENTLRISADSQVYAQLWTSWVGGVARILGDTPNLAGWMLPDDPRGLNYFDDLSWQTWVRANYANETFVNAQWKTTFENLDQVSLGATENEIASWRAGGAPTGDLSEEELKARLDAANKRPAGQNWAFHPAALVLAQAKWDAYRALLEFWTRFVREKGGGKPIFSGQLPDYAQILALPPGVSGVLPDFAPNAAENDFVTHNPQSIDVARRGGRRQAFPVLTLRATRDVPVGSLVNLLPRWIEAAYAHGASGLAFKSWQDLSRAPSWQKVIFDEIQKLSGPTYAAGWGQAPVNSTAVVLTPLAEGKMVQMGQEPYIGSRGLYGFGDDLVAGEPSDLVWALRWGTAFGGVDYLAPEDLDGPLDRYTTIFLPQMLSASGEATQNLAAYVQNGGVAVADLGLGALQNGGQANSLPSQLLTMFGAAPAWELRSLSFNLSGVAAHPLMPSWGRVVAAQQGTTLTAGDGPNGAAFAGPVGFAWVQGNATPLAQGPQIPQEFGPIKRILKPEMTANNWGRGFAVFAPFRLWNYWRPGQAGFDAFHGDLLSRGALLAAANVPTLVPLPKPTGDGSVYFPEVINRPGEVVFLHHGAPNTPPLFPVVQTSGAGDFLWNNCVATLSNDAQFFAPGARPAPIEVPGEFETRPRPVTLYAKMEPGTLLIARMRPYRLQNRSGGALSAQILEESAKKLKINVWADSDAVLLNGDQWQPANNKKANFRLNLHATFDGFSPAPGSKVRLLLSDFGQKADKKGRLPVTAQTTVVGANGEVVFEFSSAACSLEIEAAS